MPVSCEPFASVLTLLRMNCNSLVSDRENRRAVGAPSDRFRSRRQSAFVPCARLCRLPLLPRAGRARFRGGRAERRAQRAGRRRDRRAARERARNAEDHERAARHLADRHRHLGPDSAPAEPAHPARRADHHSRNHLRRRRRRRRLWRFDQSARLFSEQRHHPGWRARFGAQYSRTDPFNLQQIEIYNGANSVFNGSGSVGGTINLVSKVPQDEDLTILSAAAGTDNYLRGTVDTNWRIGPEVAIRLNAMAHRNDVPGRDVEDYRRWGVAPAITIGLDGPTSLTLAYVHQRDDNTPVYGVPYFLNQLNDGPLAEADDSDYFGYRNLDEQETTVDRLTATFRQEITDRISVRSLLRWQKVDQHSQTSAPQGTFCLAGTGRQPVSAGPDDAVGLPCTAAVASVTTGNGPAVGTINVVIPPGFYQPSGPRAPAARPVATSCSTARPISASRAARAGGLHNILVVGASFAWEDYDFDHRHASPRNAAGAPVLLPQESIANPTSIYTGPINYRVTGRSRRRSRQPGHLRLRHVRDRPAFRAQRRPSLRMGEGGIPGPQSRHLSAGHDRAHRAGAAAAAKRRDALFSYRVRRGLQADAATPASTSPMAMRARRPRRRCGSAAARPAAAAARRSLRRRAGNRAQLRDRRQGGSVRPPAAAHRGAVPQRAQQFPRALERSDQPDPAGRRRPLAGGRARARRVGQHHAANGRSSPITPISTARCCRASPISASPIPSAAGLRQQRRHSRSAARRPADPDAAPFGQPVHHLPAALRPAGRLRPHLSGRLRHPPAQPAAAHPISQPTIS